MAKTLEDRISRLELQVGDLSKVLKVGSLKKMKRQIIGLKEKSRKLAKDVKRAKRSQVE